MLVLFVCHGNTCRSPAAAAVTVTRLAERGLDHIEVRSAGLSPRSQGDPPNELAVAEGKRRGYSITGSARQLTTADLDAAELAIAMDHDNLARLDELAGGPRHQLRLFLDFDPHSEPGSPIPDPWGHGPEAYAAMFDSVERAAAGLVDHLGALDPN
ncbi:MAG: low molecular weight phosphotyrosine protein phosphatase [Actinomycetia bacterium]|nr:low molecular weight phosphotyrosine protein phosphatase [Actinomycetes bacterium]